MSEEQEEKEEDETIDEQVLSRDVREMEKCLVLGSRIYQILQKRVGSWKLKEALNDANTICMELFCRLYKVGFESIFEKHNQILKVLGTTQEEVLGKCR